MVMVHLALAAPATAETSTQRAKRHNRAAERLFNLGLFEQAAEEYQNAYRAKPVPDFLHNLAQCYRRLDTVDGLERALFYFRSYLRNAPGSPLRKRVERVMARTQHRLEELRQTSARQTSAPQTSARQTSGPPASSPVLARSREPVHRPSSRPILAVATLATPSATRSVAPLRPTPFYKRWWFWTVVGGVVTVAAVTSTAVVLSRNSGTVEGSLAPGTMTIHAP